MTNVVNINEVLDGHVTLEVECVDRLYLNAYVPNLQTSGQVAYFMRDHLGMPIPSPAVMEKIGNRFRREVKAFAAEHEVPILQLKKPDRSRWDDRKLDHVQPHLVRAEREGRFGVVAIVAAQEFAWVFSCQGPLQGPRQALVRVRPRTAPLRGLLLLRPRPRVRSGLHQDRHLLPSPGQGVV